MGMNADTPVIEAQNLTIGYGDIVIRREMTFRITAGEICVIAGVSGCGKSTLLRHLMGLQPALEGKIIILGKDIAELSRAERRSIRQSCGVLFQSGALFGSLTLGENIDIVLQEYTTLPPDARAVIVRMKLRMVGLDGFEDYLPGDISGGMKKRAGLARALALDPPILFFDEPSAGLDPVTSRELDETIVQINKSLGTTMVIVTHELASIFAIADRVIMLGTGDAGIIAEGRPEELKESHESAVVHAFFNRESRKEIANNIKSNN
jgi:phospholipid/cholesterol/gamma-HCH transport system ATP-binding protein